MNENELMTETRMAGEKVREADDGLIWFRASTDDVDRKGTIISPMGIQTDNFDLNPVFLWGHDGYGRGSTPDIDNVIGKVETYRKSERSFDIGVRFASEINPKAEKAEALVRAGILGGVSIGFLPNEEKIGHRDAPTGGTVPVFNEVDLLEVSLVPIPANPHAGAIVRAYWGVGNPIQSVCVEVDAAKQSSPRGSDSRADIEGEQNNQEQEQRSTFAAALGSLTED